MSLTNCDAKPSRFWAERKGIDHATQTSWYTTLFQATLLSFWSINCTDVEEFFQNFNL